MHIFKWIFVTLVLSQNARCARILGLFTTPGYSHFVLGETLFKELAARGHDLTVVSCFPQKEKLKNYRDIMVTELNDWANNVLRGGNILDHIGKSYIKSLFDTQQMGLAMTELSLQSENVKNLVKSKNESFDLIIMEQFLNEAHFGFMHRFKAPLILVSSTTSSLWTNRLMGNPTPYSYVPFIILGYSPKMNLFQRAYNTFIYLLETIQFHGYVLPKHNEIMHNLFPDAPPLQDLIHNASLMFINSHPTIGAAVPLQPNTIEIGGFHVQNHNQSLSADLKKFLDEADNGVIYFSLGSNMKSTLLPQEKVQGILRTFSKLKMKVLWKWEDENLPGKPDNLRIEKWLPQSAVLAHKNVKIFITHGGRLSLTESLYFGKPLIGIPLFAEQHYNMQEVVYLGYGIALSYRDLGEEHLSKALKEILENPKYAEQAKFRSNALRDLKVSPLENAINWIEYVVKHKGVPHLRNAGVDLAWYQYLLLDVILLYLVVIWLIKKLFCIAISKLIKSFKGGKQKIKRN